MKCFAFLFPGQGSQYVGMGQKLFDRYLLAKQLYERANSVAGIDLLGRDLVNPSVEIFHTQFAQPAILTLSVITFLIFQKEYQVEPQWLAGHSLGEYSALVCSGAIDFDDAITLVIKRGELMSLCFEEQKFSMAAIFGVSSEIVEEVLGDFNQVYISNYNSKNQTVISGDSEQVDGISRILKNHGADARQLKLNLPFHTPFFAHQTEEFKCLLNKVKISTPRVPVISNVTARPYKNDSEIRERLSVQISHPVKWAQTMEFLCQQGITHAIEFGPKRILSKFFLDSYPKIRCSAIESNIEDFLPVIQNVSSELPLKALCILASTKNYNASDSTAVLRIQEINFMLKSYKQSGDIELQKILLLLREALELKQISSDEIDSYLCQLSDDIQLFCFPYAGGDAGIFKQWNEKLQGIFQVFPIEYPGRGKKAKLPLVNNFNELLNELEFEILANAKSSFALFGHSLGGIIAFEMVRRLEKRGLSPKFLVVSACPAPKHIHKFSGTRLLTDEDFIVKLEKLNGTPVSHFEDQAFRSFFLPILRNDFALLEGYSASSDLVCSTSITVFRGSEDEHVTNEEARTWSEVSKQTRIVEIPGDHFFIRKPDQMLSEIVKLVRNHVPAALAISNYL